MGRKEGYGLPDDLNIARTALWRADPAAVSDKARRGRSEVAPARQPPFLRRQAVSDVYDEKRLGFWVFSRHSGLLGSLRIAWVTTRYALSTSAPCGMQPRSTGWYFRTGARLSAHLTPEGRYFAAMAAAANYAGPTAGADPFGERGCR